MPVWLDAIPEKAPKIARPGTRRWLLFLAFVMLGGTTLTLWCWTLERTGFVFWFTALGLPFCIWGLIFGLRRFAYKAEQVGAESRNVEREALIDREIMRGQRCAWILGTYIETSAGNKAGDLLEAMKVAAPAKTLSNPRGCNIPVRYAALTEYHTDITHALNAAISKLTTRIEGIVQPLPPALPCWLMLECGNDVYPLVEQQLKAELLQKTGRIFHLMAGKGLGALDAWLDTRWDNPGLLVAITLSLPASPSEDDADAVSMVVFSNRKAHAWPDALRLYRPERGSEATLTKTLERALLWAKIGADTLRGSWISGPCLIAGSAWNNACEENDVKFSLVEDNFSIDPVLGYAGHAAPWVAITLANAAFEQRGAQVIAAQPNADKKDIWVSVITNEDDCKGMSRNV
ncbi:hypothetical protein [Atlantibacter hermannii]|uniref:hypothetical protein n=1 Tax=Atlantibacter hermannii TaxID=565 RepID=UPI00289F0887|nr:hypothetical protein [Atlantibacter hermannii]